jgi:hypothetical protein
LLAGALGRREIVAAATAFGLAGAGSAA